MSTSNYSIRNFREQTPAKKSSKKLSSLFPSGVVSKLKFERALVTRIILVIVGLVAVATAFIYIRTMQERASKVTIGALDVKVFFSKSSVDTEKKEQYSFTDGEPIQGAFAFSDAKKGSQIVYKIYRVGETDKPIQETPIGNLDGNGDRYVTAPRGLGTGDFVITVEQNGVLLDQANFTVKPKN